MNFPHYLRIGAEISFLDALAGWLLKEHENEPLALAQTLVLLPSRRACRNLREAFLRTSNGAPMLLPRVMPIGEVDAESDIISLMPESDSTLPAMPEKNRLAILSRLIMQGNDTTPARAYQLAVELAKLLDDVSRHKIGFENLEALAPLELAEHWQKTTEFLTIVTRMWPRILEAEGKADNVTITSRRIEALAKYWRENPPAFPIIAAGMTAALPATAALLDSIANMPNGKVILPGFDAEMNDESWELLDATHPQYGFKKLLGNAEVKRSHVAALISSNSNQTLRSLFTPAALTAHWREEVLPLEKDVQHIRFMQAGTQIEEARMIAYQLREMLETPGKTAALITPDRTLARMVASECMRYGIRVDDSAGQSLNTSPAAIFMQLIMELIETGSAPHTLLALLRHPFAAAGIHPATVREYSRTLEKEFLRGVRFASGFDALVDEIKKRGMKDDFTQFFIHLKDVLRPLEMLFLKREAHPLSELIRAHILAAEALTATDEKPGADILWAKESGTALATLLAEWIDAATTLGNISPHDYPALFAVLIAGSAVRAPFGTHPRLHIFSPIEARLTHFDRVILGEMNEGTWPAAPTLDPWMSAPMREAFGLPAHTISIGQGAHDIWMHLHAPEVILTRARKISGKPQEMSRWWVRLTTLIGGKDAALLAKMDISNAMQLTINEQDKAYEIPSLTRPEPVPPQAARPRNFSPSSIDLWSREPYAFYAKKILKLDALPPLDQEPDNRDFGELIHSALEHFSAEYPHALPEHAYQLLINHGQREFQPFMHQPAVTALWWPRFEAIARNWLARERELRREKYSTKSEVTAKWEFELAHETITLNARADRVDDMSAGFRLMDYKTGTPPSKKKVEEGEAKQLPLTALALMRSGAVEKIPTALIYWALKTREQGKDFVEITDATALLEKTEEELMIMIGESLLEETSYAPAKLSQLSEFQDEYDHLIRREEWGNA